MVADEGFAGFAVLPLKLQGQNNFKPYNTAHRQGIKKLQNISDRRRVIVLALLHCWTRILVRTRTSIPVLC